ncbi:MULTISPECIES: hypothetical protein [unclassified Streptomyces]|uniref:DUF7144 family membrane protein n=1 Tax=unclassified Streptomyces TaxID=2593676 RepID=UPI003803003D
MSQNTAHRPPTTSGTGTGIRTGTGTGFGTTSAGTGYGTGYGTGVGTGAHTQGRAAWARGGSLLAGILMLVTGATTILQAVVAFKRDSFLNSVTNYAYTFNLTSWGWIHVIIGGLLALTGIALLATRASWARFVGIGLAGLLLVAQFMYLPYQPIWSVMGMALSAFIIWALATDRFGSGART